MSKGLKKEIKEIIEQYNIDLSEEFINEFKRSGQQIYFVKLKTKQDLLDKDRTPYEFIEKVEALGECLVTVPTVPNIGLDDCFTSAIDVNFLLATDVEYEQISKKLDVASENVIHISFDELYSIL